MNVKFKRHPRHSDYHLVKGAERIKKFAELYYEITSCALCAHTCPRGDTRYKGRRSLRIDRRSRKSYTQHFTPHIISFCKKFYSLSLFFSVTSHYYTSFCLSLSFLVFFFSFALKI